MFPNLKKLYAGNTSIGLWGFTEIIRGLKKLELLDLSLCPNFEKINITPILAESSLKILFSSASSIEELEHRIEFKNTNIYDILNSMRDIGDLKLFKTWLKDGEDVNIFCSKAEAQRFSCNHPQIRLIEKDIDEGLLIECYRLMMKYDLDIHITLEDHPWPGSTLSCNLVCVAINFNKIALLKFFIEKGVPLKICHANVDWFAFNFDNIHQILANYFTATIFILNRADNQL